MTNYDIARYFEESGNLLDIKGDNQFRVRSYLNAARTISELSQSVTDMVHNNEDLAELPGIGKELSQKIIEIVETGGLTFLSNLKKEIPESLLELLRIEGLGGKKIGKLYRELGIKNFDDLERAIHKNKIQNLEGFGKKSEEKIKNELERVKKSSGEDRFLLATAYEIVTPVIDHLKKIKSIKQLIPAGSYRRCKETVGDIDLLATCDDPEKVMEQFVSFDDVQTIIAHGSTKSSVKLRSGLQIDLRVVPEESYGAALHYFTGSKEHNVAVRKRGIERGLKINEYGVYRGEKRIAGGTEDEVYRSIGLSYIEPELRENRGEIEAVQTGDLPELVKVEDIKGDLQTHSSYSDGKNTIEEMVKAAIELGYEYISITDHSKRVSVANGMDEKRLAEQIKYIDSLQNQFPDFKIIKSIEVDILPDGSLDLSNEILKELDLVLCSVHYNRNLSLEEQTERIIKALDNPYFDILAHPTGRLIGSRGPYQIDMEKILEAARERGCFLEINAHPERLDLNDVHAKRAKEMGIKVPVSTDSHATDNLKNIQYGVNQARRAWLTKDDVLNTRSWKELSGLLRRNR